MSTKTNPGKLPDKRRTQLDTVLIQLTSSRPSEVWRGTEQIRQWLRADKDDREVYGVLLDAVQKNPELREDVRNIFSEMMQLKSEVAEQALSRLPTFIPDILAEADDAYYAAEYHKAIQLYQQVLRLDSENVRAKDHLGKAVIKRDTGEATSGLPRTAQQYYLRARSYLAADEVVTALNLLSAAIEAAQAKGMKYPEAEETLINVQKVILAEEHINKAKTSLEIGQRKEALSNFETALKLNPSKPGIRGQIIYHRIILNIWWEISVIIIIGLFAYFGYPKFLKAIPSLASTKAVVLTTKTDSPTTPSIPFTNTSTTPSLLATTSNTFTPLPTNTLTPSTIFTETPLPSPTEKTLGNGYINKAIASAWLEPNKNKITTLNLNQVLILLEDKFVSGSTWYRCRWESDGTRVEGWILAENITLGPPPTPRP